MLHYYKYHESVLAPRPAREVYVARGSGRGWPEQCPAVRAANAFGWDVLSNFDLTFIRGEDGRFALESAQALPRDWGPEQEGEGDEVETQNAAWFWDPEQTLPHPISPEVFQEIQHQVKVSSYLFLQTDPNEMLLLSDIPNRPAPYRVVPGIVETDWYSASHPWQTVLELDPSQERIEIRRGDPITRLVPIRRETYLARAMSSVAFTEYMERGQDWLQQHGHGVEGDMVDIRRSYRRQQLMARFWTDEPST